MSTQADSIVWKAVQQADSSFSTKRKREESSDIQAERSKRQKVESKDELVAAATSQQSQTPIIAGQPELVAPQGSDESPLSDPANTNLIAIIGSVLALIARTDSDYWKNLWQQASQSMQIQVKFAPLIAAAVKTAALNESKATLEDASKEREEGVYSLTAFSVTVATGFAMGASEGLFTPEEDAAVTNETKTGAKAAGKEGEGAGGAAAKTEDELQSLEGKDIQEPGKQRAKNAASTVGNSAKRGTKTFIKLLEKIGQVSMASQPLTNGLIKLTVEAPHDTKKAAYQYAAGKAQAVSKEEESYQQYYSQDFSRTDQLGQGTQQNIDYAMNILLQTAQTITSTSISMFQG